MNLHWTTRSLKEKAFTLSEVTMSVGIVSAVLLPVLGLLATGSRLTTVSQDQSASARIAATLVESLQHDPSGDGRQLLILSREESVPVDSSGAQPVFAAFTASGTFLKSITEAEFRTGLPEEPDALYLAIMSLKPLPAENGGILRGSPLLALEIAVEQPAMTQESNRTRRRFHSRTGAP